MAHRVADRVKETTSTTGTGAYTTTGAVSQFQPFNIPECLAANGDTTWYCAFGGADFEIGLGTRTGVNTIARTTIKQSSNGDAAVNWTTPPTLFCTIPASEFAGAMTLPAFRAYRVANVATWPQATYQKATLDGEALDASGDYDPATGRFQPKIAGYYQFNWLATCTNGTGASAKLYKNGVAHSEGAYWTPLGGTGRTGSSDLVFLNGSTDYVELWVYIDGTGVRTLLGGSDQTYLSGHLVAAAVTGVGSSTVIGFSAYRATDQTGLTNNAFTKALFNAEEFDTVGSFDATTNNRFQPTVPGFYQVNAAARLAGTTLTDAAVQIYKNGAAYGGGSVATPRSNVAVCTVSKLVYLNGTTDYLELFVFAVGTVMSLTAGTSNSFFTAHLVGTIGVAAPVSGPAFNVRQSAQQAFTAGTYAKVNLATEDFDTNGCYDTATSRFQPTVAGYYRVSGQVTFAGPTTVECSVYKNGTQYKAGTSVNTTANSSVVTALVFLNGSTDYVELWAFSGASQNTHPTIASYTHFEGEFARAV